MREVIRAFSSPNYDYYRLTKDFGLLKAGTIFYHDPNDDIYGSVAEGCLKNCWTADGDCSGSICGGTVILHYHFVNTDLFEKVDRTINTLADSLRPGSYELNINGDGRWEIKKHGSRFDF